VEIYALEGGHLHFVRNYTLLYTCYRVKQDSNTASI
jgi:hypothetical protein